MSKTLVRNQELISNFLKNYGFIFPNSEIYGGLANAWDYGPLGVLLKRNIKNIWWQEFVTKNPEAVGLDSAIINNTNVWKGSGHLKNFSDLLIECKDCHNRFRADHLAEKFVDAKEVAKLADPNFLYKTFIDNKIKCPTCGKSNWTDIRQFNLMFKTFQGPVDDEKNIIFLRPETAQGIFINFNNIRRSLRLKIPFAVGQIGKSFRNEITPGNYIFRTREFEQMELEYFVHPTKAPEVFESELAKIKNFLFITIGMDKSNFQFHEHAKEELSHYSARTVDIEYNFPHGTKELWGIANRTNFDLTAHQELSKQNLTYLDEQTKEKYVPYVVEPSVGVERLFYAIICDKYYIEKLADSDEREVLCLPFALAPYKVAIFPLSKELIPQAEKIYQEILKANISCTFDKSGSIGKRYRRQDAIGTPFCITVDYDSEKNKTVTIRERDSMKQTIIKITDIVKFLQNVEFH